MPPSTSPSRPAATRLASRPGACRRRWPRPSRPPGRLRPRSRSRSVEGLRLLHAGTAGQRLLAPDDLAGRRPAGAPALGELAHDLQPAAALVLAVGLAQSRQRAGGVEDLADQRFLVDEPERYLAARV